MSDHTLVINGLNLRYTVEGQGPDVILVHGWASSRHMWDHLLERLTPYYRCWALDLPGYGDSDKPTGEWYSIPQYTETVRAFAQACEVERFCLVGHSMGGMIALDIAARLGHTVERLALINPVVTGASVFTPLVGHNATSRRLLELTLQIAPKVWVPAVNHPVTDQWPGMQHIRRRTWEFHQGTPTSMLGSGQAATAYNVVPRLKNITARTLFILGALDVVVPISEGKLAAKHIRSAQVVTLLTTGHMPTDDLPAETVRLLRQCFE